jgi:hypothetical protein
MHNASMNRQLLMKHLWLLSKRGGTWCRFADRLAKESGLTAGIQPSYSGITNGEIRNQSIGDYMLKLELVQEMGLQVALHGWPSLILVPPYAP